MSHSPTEHPTDDEKFKQIVESSFGRVWSESQSWHHRDLKQDRFLGAPQVLRIVQIPDHLVEPKAAAWNELRDSLTKFSQSAVLQSSAEGEAASDIEPQSARTPLKLSAALALIVASALATSGVSLFLAAALPIVEAGFLLIAGSGLMASTLGFVLAGESRSSRRRG